MTLENALALTMFASLVAYALLAGADFGAGVWDLLSRGPRSAAQRQAIAHAIGPVWEANHVWLIFLIVLLFTCFPSVYAAASHSLFWPLHLVLAGIVLRGASFVFRAYGSVHALERSAWGHVFGAASCVTPLLLGMCLGAVSIDTGPIDPAAGARWWAPFPLATGLLALLLCAYLAAVYLAWETEGALSDDFRRRALVTWFVAGVASMATLLFAWRDAHRLWQGLTSGPAAVVVVVGTLLAPVSAIALWRRRYRTARITGAAQVVVLLSGWALAQWPYLIYPTFTIADSAAPRPTLVFIAATLPLGLGVLVPSLWFLFKVFKGQQPDSAPRA